MEKLQVLFPEPQLRRLRQIAKNQDRPVSELVRSAVDLWLLRQGNVSTETLESPPEYHCGKILLPPEDLREAAYDVE